MQISAVKNLEHFHNKSSVINFKSNFENNKPNFYNTEPEIAINWNYNTTISNLERIIGKEKLRAVLNGVNPKSPAKMSNNGTDWFKQAKIIGINPRAAGTYFNIVKYAMTFPEDTIHILPMFEPGGFGSLYSPLNWQLSREFMDDDLVRAGYDTPEKQLGLTVSLLHALGKNVGFDLVMHTDRFSEEVFLNPDNYSWVQLNDDKTKELQYPDIDPDKIGSNVKEAVVDYLLENGSADATNISENDLCDFYSLDDDIKRSILFGNGSVESKNTRRIELMNWIRARGLESKPVHIDNPMTKINFDRIESSNGVTWAEFTDNMNNNMFGSITPYKLYHLDKNANIDLKRPNVQVWDYLNKNIKDFQQKYGFDFLRADMGNINYQGSDEDFHGQIKEALKVPYFATFGECLNPFDQDVNKKKKYDAVLGNAHYMNTSDEHFLDTIRAFNSCRDYKTAITSLTADSDDEEHKYLYNDHSNTIRTFMGLFLDKPSYSGMGIETREEYQWDRQQLSRYFINDYGLSNYRWGNNKTFFRIYSTMRKLFSQIKDTIQNQFRVDLRTSDNKVGSWVYMDDSHINIQPSYLFVANADKRSKSEVDIENIFETCEGQYIDKNTDKIALKEVYSTKLNKRLEGQIVTRGRQFKLTNLAPGECRVYKVLNSEQIENVKNRPLD